MFINIGGEIDPFDSKIIKVKTNMYIYEFNVYSYLKSLKSKYS